jgi:inosine-uridine nucleoside N-ribohydrolase
MTVRLIVDTDAGVDDAQAILMALTHPGVTIEAISTLTGNVHVDKVVPNVFTILDVMGRSGYSDLNYYHLTGGIVTVFTGLITSG